MEKSGAVEVSLGPFKQQDKVFFTTSRTEALKNPLQKNTLRVIGSLSDIQLHVLCWKKINKLCYGCGARGLAGGRGTALQAGRSRVRFPMVSLEFFIYILPAALWPRGRLSLQQK
jgi:hypothetical protein